MTWLGDGGKKRRSKFIIRQRNGLNMWNLSPWTHFWTTNSIMMFILQKKFFWPNSWRHCGIGAKGAPNSLFQNAIWDRLQNSFNKALKGTMTGSLDLSVPISPALLGETSTAEVPPPRWYMFSVSRIQSDSRWHHDIKDEIWRRSLQWKVEICPLRYHLTPNMISYKFQLFTAVIVFKFRSLMSWCHLESDWILETLVNMFHPGCGGTSRCPFPEKGREIGTRQVTEPVSVFL